MSENLEWTAEVNDKASDVLEKIQDRLQDTSKSAGKVNRRTSAATRALRGIKSAGSGAAKVLGGVAVAGGAVATALGVKSVRAASEFSASIQEATAKVDASQRTLRRFEEAAIRAGAKSMFSARQAGDALGFLAQAGFDANQSISALPKTLQLATAGNLEVAQAADIASNVLTGYGLQVRELARVNDVLVRTQADTNTNTRQLGQAFSLVAPQARAAGLSIEQTAAAIGFLSNAGIQGTRAGTTLRGALARLTDPSSKAQSVLNRLGVEVKTTGGEMRNLFAILQDLQRAQRRAGDMTKIFGRRAGPGMQALLSQGIGALEKFEKRLKSADGTAKEMASFMKQSLSGQMRILQGSIDTLAITVGQQFAPFLKVVVDRLTSLTNAMRSNDQSMQRIQQTIAETIRIMASLGDVMRGVVDIATFLAKRMNEAFTGLQIIGKTLEQSAHGLAAGYHDLRGDHRAMIAELEKANEASRERSRLFQEGQERSERLSNAQRKLNAGLKNASNFLRGVADEGLQVEKQTKSLADKERELREAIRKGNSEMGTRVELQRELHNVQSKQKVRDLKARRGQLQTNLGAVQDPGERQLMRQKIAALDKRIARLSGGSTSEVPASQTTQGDGDGGPTTETTPSQQGPTKAELERRRTILRIEKKIARAESQGAKVGARRLKLVKNTTKMRQQIRNLEQKSNLSRSESLKLDELRFELKQKQRKAAQDIRELEQKGSGSQSKINDLKRRAVQLEQQGKQVRAATLKFQARKRAINQRDISDSERKLQLAKARARFQDRIGAIQKRQAREQRRAQKEQVKQQKAERKEREKARKAQRKMAKQLGSQVQDAARLAGEVSRMAGASEQVQGALSGASSALSSGLQAAGQFASGNIIGGIGSVATGAVQAISQISGGGGRSARRRARRRREAEIRDLRETVKELRKQGRSRQEFREDVRAGNLAALREAQRESLRPVNVVFQGNTFMERSERVSRHVNEAQKEGQKSVV